MLTVIAFLAILGPLVIVHEFGHYIFARIFGVKAEVFSVGFGPKIWGKKIGETEWRWSVFPLGGYVKLMGEDGSTELSPEDRKRALTFQPAWKRFFIFFGGPLFNFLFAIVVFMAILVIGEDHPAAVIGRVVRGSVAEQAGFRSGDQILMVGAKVMRRWDEVIQLVSESPGKKLDFAIAREGKESVVIHATPTSEQGYSMYGEPIEVGEIVGLSVMARATTIGISDPRSPAARAGLKTGDKLSELNGQPVTSWEKVEKLYDRAVPKGMAFRLRAEGGKEISLTRPEGSTTLGRDLGLHSSELFIEKTVAKSPAEGAGLLAGDRIVSIGGRDVESFFDLKDSVQRDGEKSGKIEVRWERNGALMSASVVPTATAGRDPALKKTTQFTIGIVPALTWTEPPMVVERVWNPFVLLWKGTERMAIFTYRNVVSLRKMISGDVSVGTLGGPILIGKIAGEALSRGLVEFLRNMAILSVGLGILNVLPIPVLDGGHLMLLSIEVVRRRPLTLRQMEIVQQVGLSLILLLMVVVIRNDLTRISIFN